MLNINLSFILCIEELKKVHNDEMKFETFHHHHYLLPTFSLCVRPAFPALAFGTTTATAHEIFTVYTSMLNWLSWFNLRNRFIYSKSSIDVNFSHPPYICSMKFAIADSLTLDNIVMVASVAKTVTFKQYMKQQICRWLFKFFAHEYYIQF